MIDLHTHILPGIDDGAASLPEAVAMAAAASRDGCTIMLATPHGPGDDLPALLANRDGAIQTLQNELRKNAINLTILPGLEYRIGARTLQDYEDFPAIRLGFNPATPARRLPLLIELPPDWHLGIVADLFFQAQLKHVPLVLAHPERYVDFPERLQQLQTLMQNGLWLQINVDAFRAGWLGWLTRHRLCRLIQHAPEQVIIASDCHSPTLRPPGLTPAYDYIEKKMGPPLCQKIFRENAGRLLGL